jgi:hypothetical protein
MLPELKVEDMVEILDEDWKTLLKRFEEFLEAKTEKGKLSSSVDIFNRLNKLNRVIFEALEEEIKSP